MRRFALGIQISFVAPSSGWGGGGGGGRGRVAAAAAAAARQRREDQWPSIRSLVAASTTRTKVFVDWQLIISSRARRAAPRPSRARLRARSRPARPASLSPVELDSDAGKSFCLCRVWHHSDEPDPPPAPASWRATRCAAAARWRRTEARRHSGGRRRRAPGARVEPSIPPTSATACVKGGSAMDECRPLAPPLAPPPRAARRALLPLPSSCPGAGAPQSKDGDEGSSSARGALKANYARVGRHRSASTLPARPPARPPAHRGAAPPPRRRARVRAHPGRSPCCRGRRCADWRSPVRASGRAGV